MSIIYILIIYISELCKRNVNLKIVFLSFLEWLASLRGGYGHTVSVFSVRDHQGQAKVQQQKTGLKKDQARKLSFFLRPVFLEHLKKKNQQNTQIVYVKIPTVCTHGFFGCDAMTPSH